MVAPAPTPRPSAASQSVVLLQHPQANRQVVLAGQMVGYHFRRGQRRTIGLAINVQGLTVTAPSWTGLAAVDAAVLAKADWVLRKLAQVAQHHQGLEQTRICWEDGAQLSWQGSQLQLRLHAAEGALPRGQRTALVARDGQELWVRLPAAATERQLQDAVQVWMMQAAHAHFVQRLDHFAPLLGVQWRSLRLSSAHTRWGSAKKDGSIRLHWRLMQFAPEVLDYVVAHELSHLHHMDHSPRFWQTVATVVPDYAQLRARLRGEHLPPW